MKKTNRKITLLLLATVATILPAVAVADVLITGNVSIVGTQNSPVFDFEPGPNYYAAHSAGSITWNPGVDQSSTMGSFDLEGIVNQTTAMANVLDLNITIAAGVNGVLYVNFTGDFPAGALVWITPAPVTIAAVMSGVGGQPVNSAAFVYSGPFSGGTTTYYVSFYLPFGTYSGASGTITGTFIAS